jgi:DNA-binding transcriptional ArsR family regulator
MSETIPRMVRNIKTLDPEQIIRAAEFFTTLADPTRIKILTFLLTGNYTVNEIRNFIGLTLPAVSYQLRILKEHDLVRYLKRGREKIFRIADSHVVHLINDGLSHIGGMGLCEGKLVCE